MSDQPITPDTLPADVAAGAGGELAAIDWEERELGEYSTALRRCYTAYRAALGWYGIDSVEDLAQAFDYAAENLDTGEFFLTGIGRISETERYLVMGLIVIRMRWMEEFEVKGMAETLLVDQALMAFYHQMRLHEMIGNVQARAEHEYLGTEPLRGNDWDRLGRGQYKVDEYLREINVRLLPALERCQRMLMRSLQALQRQRMGRLVIKHASQVNVAQQQFVQAVAAIPEQMRPTY